MNKTTLLITIESPTLKEPVRFMCGHDFEVLRTDITGDDVYGLRHEGDEYLFFPLSFHPLDAGVLSMRLPADYIGSHFSEEMNGARITFGAKHGSPIFAIMPEEYHSSSGTLILSEDGHLKVFLDKVTAAEKPATADNAHDACGCGHHHPVRVPAPDTAATGTQDDDIQMLAESIRNNIEALNRVLEKAEYADLHVELECLQGGAEKHGCPRLVLGRILKPV